MQASNQEESLRRLVFEELVAIAFPGSGKRFGARFVQELFQNFEPPKFAQQIVVKFFPIFAQLLFDRGQGHTLRDVAGLVKIGVHDLLGGCRRI